MCIISDTVKDVSRTKIFAAKIANDHQIIVYMNSVDTATDNVMILPVPANTVKYIHVKDTKFFDKFDDVFKDGMLSKSLSTRNTYLKVDKVGSYIASHAKNIKDLHRIDPSISKTTINQNVINVLVKYYGSGFSFIVCKLVKGSVDYHPFAYSHKIADSIFVPTRHIHIHGSDETKFKTGLLNNIMNTLKENPIINTLKENPYDRKYEKWDHEIYFGDCKNFKIGGVPYTSYSNETLQDSYNQHYLLYSNLKRNNILLLRTMLDSLFEIDPITIQKIKIKNSFINGDITCE